MKTQHSQQNTVKQQFANDNNTLNKSFYLELLHIIGLEEVNEGSKPIIKRKKLPLQGTLIENTIAQIKKENCLAKIHSIDIYGDTEDEQLFNIALELNIIWINRILLLKLLESQLVSFHNEDKNYKFLNSNQIPDFQELNYLFFSVLAVENRLRNEKAKHQYKHIPYLNSSLFEPSDLEQQTIFIEQLECVETIPLIKNTILKEYKGLKHVTELNALQYLLDFLDAYNFSSEPSAVFTKDTNNLINAAILGLIFEKINGYKEGAIFTPGYITMYMCRETIRRAVIEKFRPVLKLSESLELSESWTELSDKITIITYQKANEIVNSIRVCDPSVGSGHFLVSALNEMICIKADLKILCDKNGQRLENYKVENVRDELEIKDTYGNWFRYNLNAEKIPFLELQRIQETIFHEKQKIIENCLFGVDINPNSVNICRLRLWIELLKHAYYKSESNYTELETLPNIDVNIKCGNSLVQRIDLKENISDTFIGTGFTFKQYKELHELYRSETMNKELKRTYELKFNEIKNKVKHNLKFNHPLQKKIDKLKNELHGNLFPTDETDVILS